MCGIGGIVSDKLPEFPHFESFIATMNHRGPDSRGFFSDGCISLGMCRLAINEIEFGTQPAKDVSGQVIAVLNGEIYNYKELRTLLSYRLSNTESFSEVQIVANLYQIFGLKFVTFLKGMFAIAIWNSKDKSLTLFRDRFGEKPLYYVHNMNEFAFASEIRPLEFLGLSGDISLQSISDLFLFGYILPKKTIYENILSVPPGCSLVFKGSHIEFYSYWKLEKFDYGISSFDDALNQLDQQLSNAVRRQMLSEKKIGIYLSGGVDSSLISFYAGQFSQQKINSFSIIFDDKEFDESFYSRQIACDIQSEHHEIRIEPDAEDLERCLLSLDQPFADASYLATFLLNRHARNFVTVALGGDGGDESMLGYDRYRAFLVYPYVKYASSLLSGDLSLFKFPRNRLHRLLSYAQSSSDDFEFYKNSLFLNSPKIVSEIINGDLEFNDNFIFDTSETEFLSKSGIYKGVFFDTSFYLPGDILYKSDMASMAHSIEHRSPFLDSEYFQFSFNLPNKYKISLFQGKKILKSLASSKFPNVDFDRKKQGFGIPRSRWLRGPFKEYVMDTLSSNHCRNRGLYDYANVSRVLNDHMDKGINRESIIWPLLTLESWFQSRSQSSIRT